MMRSAFGGKWVTGFVAGNRTRGSPSSRPRFFSDVAVGGLFVVPLFHVILFICVCECVWVCVCVCGRFAPLLVYCFSFSSSIFFPISLMSFVRPIPDGISWLKTTLPVVVVVGLYHDGRQIFPDEVERNYDGARSSRRKRKKTSKRNTKTKTKHHHGKCKQRRQMTKKNNMPEADSGAFFIFVSRFHRFISSWQKKNKLLGTRSVDHDRMGLTDPFDSFLLSEIVCVYFFFNLSVRMLLGSAGVLLGFGPDSSRALVGFGGA